jgi:hypothetical protein
MSRMVLLDAGPLGLATNPKAGDEHRRCEAWIGSLVLTGSKFLYPREPIMRCAENCSGSAGEAALRGSTTSGVLRAFCP